MFVIGDISLITFPFAEGYVAKPAIDLKRPRHLGSGQDIIVTTLISMADALSVMISYAPAYNWGQITFGWSVQHSTDSLQAG